MKTGENRTEVIEQIMHGDEALLQEVMDAVSARYRVAYPQWDVVYLAVPKGDRKALAETLRWIWEHGQENV